MAIKNVDIDFFTQTWIWKTAVILERFLPLWVVLAIITGLFFGYYIPHLDWLESYITLFVIIILYPMMINVRIEHFTKALRNIKFLAAAWFISFVISPLIGVLWVHLIFKDSDPYLKVGFVLVTIMPCGALIASWTGYARGSVESALVIVGSGLLLSILMVPLWLYFFANMYVKIEVTLVIKKLGLVVILPLLAGLLSRRLLIRRYGVENYIRLAPILPSISICAMIAILICIMAMNSKTILSSHQALLLIIVGLITLYPLLFVVALAFGKLTRLDYSDTFT
jgi:ACR3 family arsenite efflux pump ArsB